ncbi:MAG: hypothetical protein EO766_11920 [Hydrotalea sp. AMD]|uniref:hypothetical protein n=1 Tax=Hydrotalea sp. AMD TaxID=2501297 RepID=UPI0010274132|nr:hypothetical protein [Hydrotalea sp. AMD]RWZ87226.1 MAG: hypothetical protein EO766_11920 [Hydrotalea sp. AMD]
MTTQISKTEIQQIFHSQTSNRFYKFREVQARKAIPCEVVVTVINGEIETKNVADQDSVVVMNITTKSREQHIISTTKFASRYQNGENITEDWSTFQPIGEVDAMEWFEDSVEFEAPWGELMIIHKGDFLCGIPDSPTDIYRIARAEFFDTYSNQPKTSSDETITISVKEYDELVESSIFLTCLENAGVDNWSGYSFAKELLEEYE